jgi:hypothetical protein
MMIYGVQVTLDSGLTDPSRAGRPPACNVWLLGWLLGWCGARSPLTFDLLITTISHSFSLCIHPPASPLSLSLHLVIRHAICSPQINFTLHISSASSFTSTVLAPITIHSRAGLDFFATQRFFFIPSLFCSRPVPPTVVQQFALSTFFGLGLAQRQSHLHPALVVPPQLGQGATSTDRTFSQGLAQKSTRR